MSIPVAETDFDCVIFKKNRSLFILDVNSPEQTFCNSRYACSEFLLRLSQDSGMDYVFPRYNEKYSVRKLKYLELKISIDYIFPTAEWISAQNL